MNPESFKIENPVLLFDGYCNLCNGAVLAVIKRDAQGIFRFASIQSDLGQSLLTRYGLDQNNVDSVVLVHNNAYSLKSEAVLDVFRLLGGLYRIGSLGRMLPRIIRDGIYDWVARNRYGWFGKKEFCMTPTPKLKDRFLS